MSPQDQQFLQVATRLALEASQKILTFQNSATITGRKSDDSIVTEADLASDKIIREGLAAEFLQHSILTEEAGLQGDGGAEYVWVVDPLDGTKAFAKNKPGWSVMIGLLRRGEPYLGVVVDPLEGYVYQAIKGSGCFLAQISFLDSKVPPSPWVLGGRKRVFVSKRDDLSKMPLTISTGFPPSPLARLKTLLPGSILEPINSVGIKVGLVVRQIGDIYLNHHQVSLWDTCAPQIILEEAGGILTHLDGSQLTYDLQKTFIHKGPTLATNGSRHSDIVKLASDLLP